ncbi:hypothetical protein FHK02_5807, partial [Spirosoma sp. LMG 31448]|nr:hypothetical protein [Spirosoma utsteinense]MBC3795148.1 hypothetical protein [Spirosoma utsteinense]
MRQNRIGKPGASTYKLSLLTTGLVANWLLSSPQSLTFATVILIGAAYYETVKECISISL